jgi:outer membrane receptor protein involved in Fe transport
MNLNAQSTQRGGEQNTGGGVITGIVIDSSTNAPIEYANIVVLSIKDTSVITGTITDSRGKFTIQKIPFGKYLLDIRFIGFKDQRHNLILSAQKQSIDMGTIKLRSGTISLENVVVEGVRNPVTYQIDKKVIDVSQMETAVSGNAAEVLENVPSVTVDIEGNVSLRGSQNFTVLIDGKPSVMDAQDILQQIPASSIKSIEIITNPSAKYDPEGTAGIINLIMKKSQNLGLSGVINANAGFQSKYGGDFLFDYKTPAITYNFGLDYNRRLFPGTRKQENIYNLPDNTTYLNYNGTMEWGRTSYGLRGGLDFNLSENDLLSLSGRYGNGEFQRNSNLIYTQWSDNFPEEFNYLSLVESKREGQYFALNSSYEHKFEREGHQILAEFFYSHHNSNESSVTTQLYSGLQTDGTRASESGPENEYQGKLEYVLPVGEKNKFEAGYQGEAELSTDINGLYTFDSTLSTLVFQPEFSNSTDYNRTEQAFYSIYSAEWADFGFQGGLRAEYTYQTTNVKEENQYFEINRWDYFPTLHSSYKFGNGSQLMASYTRRIDRPHGWALEPFITWVDANNVRQGNPALEPEFIDSYDAGIQTFISKVNFSTDFYYRITQNKMEEVRLVYPDAENVTLTTFANVGKDYSLGTEFMLIYDPLEFWDMNLMGNLYDYRVRGTLYDESFDRSSFNWNLRMNNVFKIAKFTSLQINGRYNSPTVSSQGTEAGFFSTDVALKQEFLDKQLALTLQIRDLFGTAKHEFTSSTPDLYSYQYFNRESPVIMLNLKYNFNNYKQQDKEQPDNGTDQQPEDF